MAKKKVGAYLDERLANRLDRVVERFDGMKSEVMSAAIAMFLDAPPAQQRAALQNLMNERVNRFFEPDVNSNAGQDVRDEPAELQHQSHGQSRKSKQADQSK